MKKNLIVLALLLCNSLLVSAQRATLSQGQWGVFQVEDYGVYALTGNDLVVNGLMSVGDSVKYLHLYHDPRGVLNEQNTGVISGPTEVAWHTTDQNGLLESSDEFYFYAGPADLFKWNGDSSMIYKSNPYTTKSYVIAGYSTVHAGLNMGTAGPLGGTPGAWVDTHLEGAVLDSNKTNLIGTGRKWFGDAFNFTKVFNYSFDVSTAQGMPFVFRAAAAARGSSTTEIQVSSSGMVASKEFNAVSGAGSGAYAFGTTLFGGGLAQSSANQITLTVTYDKSSDPNAIMWLDNLWVAAWSPNKYKPHIQIQNFNQPSVDTVGMRVSFAPLDARVWDISNPLNPVEQTASNVAGTLTWNVLNGGKETFVVWDPDNVKTPAFKETFEGYAFLEETAVDYVIVTHEDYRNAANKLAAYHNSRGLRTVVVSTQEVYNVFSSGRQDITAIKNLLRYYKNANAAAPQYLLLLGDGSYDYKNILGDDQNKVPTFESSSSYSLFSSFITDDYFGYLDVGEGTGWYSSLHNIDVGVGRIPAHDSATANAVVDKLLAYQSNSDRFGTWKRRVVLVADDADEGWEMKFIERQDALAKDLDSTMKPLEIKKLYADSYTQETKPGSQRYPEVRTALYRAVEEGSLLVSYVGHGGEVGWATERVLQLEDVNNWGNRHIAPVFTTITCEFARFDDPSRTSAGEQLFLQNNGGAIGLFSTTRSVFATSSTFEINNLLNKNMLFNDNYTLGDALRDTKNQNNSGDKIKFSLFGDPAMPLALPTCDVVLDSINGQEWSSFTDTINALSWIQVKGHVNDPTGMLVDSGVVSLVLYDKARTESTKKNDGAGYVYNYKTRYNKLFSGKASVQNGHFTVVFRVPQDIDLMYGAPRFTTYFTDSVQDGWNGSDDFQLGGLAQTVITDTTGPEIALFVDHWLFQPGDITGPDPLALARLHDESGINATGIGIGHNIELELDGTPINVNNYYESNLNDFTTGTVKYPYYNLSSGLHTLTIRAWDVLNQWGEDSVHFYVVGGDTLHLDELLLYPNPFHEKVNMLLTHNQRGQEGALHITISNTQGNTVFSKEYNVQPTGNTTTLGVWSPYDGNSSPASGFYFVKVVWVQKSTGKRTAIQEKLIFIR